MDIFETFIKLICSEVKGEKVDFDVQQLSNEDIKKLYSLAKYHDVITILAGAFHSNNIKIDDTLQRKLQSKVSADISYIEKQKFEVENVSNVLNENGIDFILLKGNVIRKYYREQYYRNSCDIDILVHEEDLEKIKQIFIERLNYTYIHKGDHDLMFTTSSGVSIELHFKLYNYKASKLEKEIMDSSWENAVKEEKNQYKFTDEFFYFYFIYHYKKHFTTAGCGIRHIIDLYVINSKMNLCANDYKNILEKTGIYTFTLFSEQLTRIWFENDAHTETTLSMQKYIVESGVFGNENVNVHLIKRELKGKKGYFISRLWIGREEMFALHPKTKKCKLLIPFYQIARWFQILFNRNNEKRLRKLKLANNTNDETVEKFDKLFKELDI